MCLCENECTHLVELGLVDVVDVDEHDLTISNRFLGYKTCAMCVKYVPT